MDSFNLASFAEILITHMDEAVCVENDEGAVIYANPKFCKLLDYSLEELLGRTIDFFCTPKSTQLIQKINNTKRAKGVSSKYSCELIDQAGKIIPVVISGSPLPGGGTMGVMTDLREIEKKDTNEKILSQAVEYSTNGVMVLDENGKIYFWNRGAQRIFGYKSEEVKGQILAKVFPREDGKSLIQSTDEVVYNFKMNGVNKNGTKIPVATTFSPIFDRKNKKMPFYLLVSRDITHRVKVEEELALKYQKIKEAYNELGLIRRQMDYVFDFLDFSNTHNDLQSIGDYIVNSSMMLTQVDACMLRIYDKKNQTLKLVAHFGFSTQWQGKKTIPLKGGLLEKALNNDRPLKILDLASETRYSTPNLARKHNLCSLLLIPLTFRSKLIGSLSLYTSQTRKLEIFENDFIEKYSQLIGSILAKTH